MGWEESRNIPSRSSIHEARHKIGWGIWRRLLVQISARIEELYGEQRLYKGHRVYAIDGSKLNLPRELRKCKYRGSHKKCFYPQGMLVTLYRLKLGIPVYFELSRKSSEHHSVPRHLDKVISNSIVVYDRLYFSKNILRAHQKRKVHGVFRLRTGGTLKEVTEFIASGAKEQICEIKREDIQITLRFIRYKIRATNYYIATTLLDGTKYSAREILDLYHARWGVEECFKTIKQTLRVENFHSRHPIGIKQEIAISFILDCLAQVFRIGAGRKKRPTKPVPIQLIVQNLHRFWTPKGIVRRSPVDKVIFLSNRHCCQSLAGRSFQRRSRKVISRWQKNTAWEWDKKKRRVAKGLPP